MEPNWADMPYDPLDESLYSLLSPPPEMPKPEWNSEENKLFENALAELDPLSPTFFEDIASKVPWRSVDEIRLHYQALVQDLELIESGEYPIPDYPTLADSKEQDEQMEMEMEMEMMMEMESKKREGSSSDSKPKSGQPRRRGVPWTEEEHQLFLMGLNKYGKGDWRSISRYYVISKTPTQVASHAQKYFRRQTSATPADRRRPSIHDIHTVNPAAPPTTNIFTAGASSSYTHQYYQPQPQPQLSFSSRALIPNYGYSGQFLDQSAGFMPPPLPAMNNPAVVHGVFNQMPPPAALPPLQPPYYLPPFGNQHYWGGM